MNTLEDAGKSWTAKMEHARYGDLPKHLVFLAAAVSWVAKAGTDAAIQHPAALKEYDYRAARLGKWVAAWLLGPDGPRYLSQVKKIVEFSEARKIDLRELFDPVVPGEPVFGNVVKLREDMAKRGNVGPLPLEIPITVDIAPQRPVDHEIIWRSYIILKDDPAYVFAPDEVVEWFGTSRHRDTVLKAAARCGIPMASKLGRPAGAKDSASSIRQIRKGIQ